MHEEAEMISRNRMIFCVNKMASAGAAIWLQGIKSFFMESSMVIATLGARGFFFLEFFVRRLEEYERTLSVLTTRMEESYI